MPFAFLWDELVSRACQEVEDFVEDVICSAQPVVFLECAMHKALEEQWCRRAALLNDFDWLSIGRLVEAYGEDLQRTRVDYTKPGGIASVGQLPTHASE